MGLLFQSVGNIEEDVANILSAQKEHFAKIEIMYATKHELQETHKIATFVRDKIQNELPLMQSEIGKSTRLWGFGSKLGKVVLIGLQVSITTVISTGTVYYLTKILS